MRYCGIDVSARPGHQQLCTLNERRGPDGVELVTTFYEPGDVAAVARTVLGFGGEAVVAIGAPSGRGHEQRASLMARRRLPAYPVPVRGPTPAPWERSMEVGFALFAALEPLGLYRPESDGAIEGPVGEGAVRFGRLCETYPDAVFSSLMGHRPSPKRTPWGLRQRIDALKQRGVVDADGGLWHRTLDELDACAAAYAAFGLANGLGCWVGEPGDGVVVLPVQELAARYDLLPAPGRHALAPDAGG